MKHPDQETWISYLYEEALSPSRRAELEDHLATCETCRSRLDSWQQVRRQLNAWSLPPRRSRPAIAAPLLRLAAMIIVLAIGVVLGRHAFGGQPDVDSLRSQLREDVAAEMRADMERILAAAREDQRTDLQGWLTRFTTFQEDQRAQDLAAVHHALLQLDAQRRLDHASLRRDMETVAVLTDASFRLAHEQLVQVASVAGGTHAE
jgi:anti-sigma factor RsiW